MSAHRIDRFNFEFWDGSPPQFPGEHVQVFTRPGANDFGQAKLGTWGEPFTARLTSVWASYNLALLAFPLYQTLIGRTDPVDVLYNGVWLRKIFGVVVRVNNVQLIDAHACVRLQGPTYNLPGGGKLVTDWTLECQPQPD